MAKRINIYSVALVKEKGGLYDIPERGIISPDTGAQAFRDVFNLHNLPKEHMVMFSLNTKNQIAGAHVVHIGSVNSSIVHPREIFQLAILNNATSIMIAHNHPSGDCKPSNEDITVTQRLKDAGDLLGIKLLDHLIIGGKQFLSLKEKGYL